MTRAIFSILVMLSAVLISQFGFAEWTVSPAPPGPDSELSAPGNTPAAVKHSSRVDRDGTTRMGGHGALVSSQQVIVRFEALPANGALTELQGKSSGPRVSKATQRALESLGVEVSKTWCDGLLNLVSFGPGINLEAVLPRLRAIQQVRYAVPDYWLNPAAELVPNDPRFEDQWALSNALNTDIDATLAWDQTTGESTTLVAVMDSGIDYTHPDLYLAIALNNGEIPAGLLAQAIDTNSDGVIDFYDLNSLDADGNVILDSGGDKFNKTLTTDSNGNGYIDAGDLMTPSWSDGLDNDANGKIDDLTGWDVHQDDNDPMDAWGHGTHVAGIIGARGNNGAGIAGIDWAARILPQRFYEDSGGLTSAAIQAIDNSVSMGADVINASWGVYAHDPALRDAIEWAGDNGAVFVAAAGNDSNDNDSGSPYYPASYDLPNLLGVGSIDPDGKLSDFSNFGLNSVGLAAPGRNILSTNLGGGYVLWTGTSMSSPHVAGVVSLLAGEYPSSTPSELVARVLKTVKPLPNLATKTTTGGVVSAFVAVNEPHDAGPRIIAASPGGDVLAPASQLTVTFDQPIDPLTFTSADVTLEGPSGAIFATGVTELTELVFEVGIPVQTELGTYDVGVGPEIEDLLGRLMDQDSDGINGESPGDRFETEFQIVPPPAKRIIDNGDPGYVATGGWITFDGSGAKGDFDYIFEGSGSESATWTFDNLTPGIYRVSVTWEPFPNRVVDAPFTIFDGAAELVTILVDQQTTPADFTDEGSNWQNLGGLQEVTSNTLAVKLSDLGGPAGNVLVADAVRVERLYSLEEYIFQDGFESGGVTAWSASQ